MLQSNICFITRPIAEMDIQTFGLWYTVAAILLCLQIVRKDFSWLLVICGLLTLTLLSDINRDFLEVKTCGENIEKRI